MWGLILGGNLCCLLCGMFSLFQNYFVMNFFVTYSNEVGVFFESRWAWLLFWEICFSYVTCFFFVFFVLLNFFCFFLKHMGLCWCLGLMLAGIN